MNKPSENKSGQNKNAQLASSHSDAKVRMISKDEEVQLLVALSNGMQQQGLKGFTDAQAYAVWKWASDIRVDDALLKLTLAGLMTIAIGKGGERIFKAVPDAPTSTTE